MLRVRTLIHALNLLIVLLAIAAVLPWWQLVALLELLLLLWLLPGLVILLVYQYGAAVVSHLVAHNIAPLSCVLWLHLAHLGPLLGVHLLLVGEDVLQAVQALVLRLGALAPRVRLASAGVHWRRLLHHLRQELLGLAALSGSLLVLALLLGLHSSIVKRVDSSIGSAVDASVGGVESLGLRCNRGCDVLAGRIPSASLEVLLRHGDIAACVERRRAKGTILRARLLLIKVSHLRVLGLRIWSCISQGMTVWLARGCLVVPACTHRCLDQASRPFCCVVEARPHICLRLRVRSAQAEGLALFDLCMTASLGPLALAFEMSRPSQVLIMLLGCFTLMNVIELLFATVASAARVPTVALVTAVQADRPHRGVRAALPVFLLLQGGALGLRNVGAQLGANVPLVYAGLLLLHVPLILLDDLARSLDVAGARCDVVCLLHVVGDQFVVLIVAHLRIEGS